MLEINLLGTGGMVPLPNRHLTSMLLRYNGHGVLVDCGEGTQVALRRAGLGFKQIDIICLTHFHADHTAGLPGLLLTIGNSGRDEPLLIIGPKYVGQIVKSLCVIAGQLPFEIQFEEVPEQGGELWGIDNLTIACHPVEHWIPCYAYGFSLFRPGKFDPEKARALNIPLKLWSVIQRGETVEADGRTFRPDDVLGEPRKGLKVCYSTDLRVSKTLPEFVKGSDLFICEGMYGDPDMLDKAIEHRHCLFSEAAAMAKAGEVNELWLTHFSPSMPNPKEFLDIAVNIFPNTFIDKSYIRLTYAD